MGDCVERLSLYRVETRFQLRHARCERRVFGAAYGRIRGGLCVQGSEAGAQQCKAQKAKEGAGILVHKKKGLTYVSPLANLAG